MSGPGILLKLPIENIGPRRVRALTGVPGIMTAPTDSGALSLLLVEDDRADAILVEEFIADAGANFDVVWAESMAKAEQHIATARPDCILLDLHLHDTDGITGVNRIAKLDATIPVVVLTGLNDEHVGVSAVSAGAQDYLVKDRVDPEVLRRAVLYAIERKRAELTVVDLQASQLRARENARLERGLLPSPLLLDDPGVDIVSSYRPSRENALLGGDFYDFVQTPDRTVHVMIGDVAGHGADEAALGVALRIAWRALTFAGLYGSDRMRQLERILRAERAGKGIFATVLSLRIPPEGSTIHVVRAGHPGILLHGGGTVDWVEPAGGPALGLHGTDWTPQQIEVPDDKGLVLLTDGLFEGHIGRGNERLGEAGLLELARSLATLPGAAFVNALIDAVEERAQSHGGISDDIAVVRVQRTGHSR
jgi:serine phosphatase RsbU (regulator of sigma subunit)